MEFIPLGTWTHLALTYQDGTKTAYQNGIDVGFEMATVVVGDEARPIYIGADGGPSGAELRIKAMIDDVRIYDRGLTAEEIGAIVTPP